MRYTMFVTWFVIFGVCGLIMIETNNPLVAQWCGWIGLGCTILAAAERMRK